MNTLQHFTEYADTVETALAGFLPKDDECPKIIKKAVSYSLLGGGKRIRPALAMEFFRICGGNTNDILPIACSLEMIHSYSLIHDDLPCMDDDDLRRGKPSNHKVFGEANALLAGDALLTLAFETISKADASKIKPENIVKCTNILAHNAGLCGMVGGQVLDLEYENKQADEDTLINIQHNKTGMLIRAAVQLGCVAADADESKISAAIKFADNLGRVFQMVDDVLDVTADEKLLGKPVNSDIENNKVTFVSIYGIDKTMEKCKILNAQGKAALDIFGESADYLKDFADILLTRKK